MLSTILNLLSMEGIISDSIPCIRLCIVNLGMWDPVTCAFSETTYRKRWFFVSSQGSVKMAVCWISMIVNCNTIKATNWKNLQKSKCHWIVTSDIDRRSPNRSTRRFAPRGIEKLHMSQSQAQNLNLQLFSIHSRLLSKSKDQIIHVTWIMYV